MADMKAIFTASLLGLLLIGSTGTTYLLKETGTELRCRTGWELQDNGQYACGDRLVYCTSTRDSANTQNYYCAEAIPEEIPTEIDQRSHHQYLCSPEGCQPK